MDTSQSENIFVFKYQGYPLYCPYCQHNVNLFSIDYRNHLRKNPSTCMVCKEVWEVQNDQWVEPEKTLKEQR